jgi:glycine/D-amino acid oxidase-like deaminating enzyme
VDVPVAIVGGGVMGLSAAWALGRRGIASAVLDPLPRRTERNASNDESKVFRLAYGEREEDARLALRALAGWRDLERDAHVRVLHAHGLLLLGREPGSFAERTLPVLERMGRAPARLDAPQLAARHPAPARGGFDHAVLDRDGGLLDPPLLLEALESEAIARRARVFRERRVLALEREGEHTVCVLEHGRVRARVVIVAAGHRAPLLLPELAPLLRTTRQPEFAFAPGDPGPFRPEQLPLFAAFEEGFYGFPLHRGAVKVADHRLGPVQTGEPAWDPPTAAEEEEVRAWLRRSLPGLADAPLARSRVCHYDMTPDTGFLLGAHPQREGVLLAVGFSGHGFKFAPAVGEALAALALGEALDEDWAPCDPARLLG